MSFQPPPLPQPDGFDEEDDGYLAPLLPANDVRARGEGGDFRWPQVGTFTWPRARVNPDFARKLEASLVMDTRDMTFDLSALHREFPNLPVTDVDIALRAYFAER